MLSFAWVCESLLSWYKTSISIDLIHCILVLISVISSKTLKVAGILIIDIWNEYLGATSFSLSQHISFHLFSHGKAFISVAVKVWKAAILLVKECTTDLMSTNDQLLHSKGFQCRVIYFKKIPSSKNRPQSWNAQAWVCFPEQNCLTKCNQIYNRKIKYKLKAYGISLSKNVQNMYICYANKTCSKQIFQFMTSECNLNI